MKVALIGATGHAGSCILRELSQRGHQVTGIARNADKIPALPGVTAAQADASDEAGLVSALKGHDAAISAIWFSKSSPELLIRAVKTAGVPRYLVVGGAGSLEVAPGVKLFSTEQFPDAWKPEAREGGRFLDLLRAEKDLDWTFLSPSALFQAGNRTGKFRLGGDELLSDDKGVSRISFEDYAVALVNELEKPAHSRKRFTVGY